MKQTTVDTSYVPLPARHDPADKAIAWRNTSGVKSGAVNGKPPKRNP